MRMAKPEQARSCSVQALPSAHKSAWPALGSIGHNTTSRLVRRSPPVRSNTSRPTAGSRVAKRERKSVTPWRMLGLISMGTVRFGFGATRGQLGRRSSKPFGVSPMSFVLPSDADPALGSPTPVPSSPPDFLAQLTAAQQADARLNSRGRELTDQEFLGGGQPNGTRGATPDLSRVSDADLKAIAMQGPSGATGRWSTHRWRMGGLARRWRRRRGSRQAPISRRCRTKRLERSPEPTERRLHVERRRQAPCRAE